jgi:hypothetical protein
MGWWDEVKSVLAKGIPGLVDEPQENNDPNAVVNGVIDNTKKTEQNLTSDNGNVAGFVLGVKREYLPYLGIGIAALIVMAIVIKKMK